VNCKRIVSGCDFRCSKGLLGRPIRTIMFNIKKDPEVRAFLSMLNNVDRKLICRKKLDGCGGEIKFFRCFR
jgi:hypothetical protein